VEELVMTAHIPSNVITYTLASQIKTSPPTLLPFWVLPFMGAVTQLKTSPKNLTSLFDFAFLGPFLGLCTSLVFLAAGMQSTLIANPDAAQYFPHLPVSVLQLSTLGGSIVDYFYGGNGMITMQNAASTVPLHPLAIAGFSGVIMNSLELLPLGSSDGGRMSQALFGRSTHAVVGGATWLSLLVCSFLLDQPDLLIGAWVVFNLTQNDMEVPCRDEVDKVNLPRSLAAFSLWFVAILAITPMGISSSELTL
jgi:membrane-associated protease RseP (regulator of RpoE activity)